MTELPPTDPPELEGAEPAEEAVAARVGVEPGVGPGAGSSEAPADAGLRSGFVTLAGRPNVGKSTLLNAMLGTKVTIVSDKPQTTRHQVRGVLHRPGAQIVFVDTPGMHKPRTLLGERLNDTAEQALSDVDVVCLVLDATAPLGPGDRWVAARCPRGTIVVVNKVDTASREQTVEQLIRASELDFDEYFPVSARTGDGVPALVDALVARLPEGPPYYPPEVVRESADAAWVAELVREQLLATMREELPHSITTRVVEWDWPRIRVEILVERESQKGIVIGHGGSVLKTVGTLARAQLPDGVHLELFVKVERDWQRRPDALDRLGFRPGRGE